MSPGAPLEAVQRGYKRALHDAKGDKERVDIIEAAHRNIFAPDPFQVQQLLTTFGIAPTVLPIGAPLSIYSHSGSGVPL